MSGVIVELIPPFRFLETFGKSSLSFFASNEKYIKGFAFKHYTAVVEKLKMKKLGLIVSIKCNLYQNLIDSIRNSSLPYF